MRAKAIEPIHEESVGRQTRERCELIASPDTNDADLHKHNIKIKHEMADELAAMGLSRESIKRILRLDITGNEGERLRARGNRWRKM